VQINQSDLSAFSKVEDSSVDVSIDTKAATEKPNEPSKNEKIESPQNGEDKENLPNEDYSPNKSQKPEEKEVAKELKFDSEEPLGGKDQAKEPQISQDVGKLEEEKEKEKLDDLNQPSNDFSFEGDSSPKVAKLNEESSKAESKEISVKINEPDVSKKSLKNSKNPNSEIISENTGIKDSSNQPSEDQHKGVPDEDSLQMAQNDNLKQIEDTAEIKKEDKQADEENDGFEVIGDANGDFEQHSKNPKSKKNPLQKKDETE
jgi:ribosomal protein L11